MNHPFLLIFVKITIFSLMLAIGINFSFEKMRSLWQKPALLFRSLLAVVVLVPLIIFISLKLFNLPLEVMTGLVLLAASPGAPLSTKRSQQAGARFRYAVSLQLTLALLAVAIAPLTLVIFANFFENLSAKINFLEVAKQVTIVQFLPVCCGLLLQKFAYEFTRKISRPLNLIANNLFLLLIILACIIGFPLLLKVGGTSLIAIVLIVIFSLAVGHLLGGSDEDKRPILAISCIARNAGLALFIAILNNVQREVIPTLIAYLIVGGILGLLYAYWSKRELSKLTMEN